MLQALHYHSAGEVCLMSMLYMTDSQMCPEVFFLAQPVCVTTVVLAAL